MLAELKVAQEEINTAVTAVDKRLTEQNEAVLEHHKEASKHHEEASKRHEEASNWHKEVVTLLSRYQPPSTVLPVPPVPNAQVAVAPPNTNHGLSPKVSPSPPTSTMKLILSTSNIMTRTAVIRRPTFEKSNTELTSNLRSNCRAHQASTSPNGTTNGASTQPTQKPSFRTWTTEKDSTLYIPSPTSSPLSEPREAYDITVKLFYLPGIPADRRCAQTREAIDLVLRELGTTSIDLLIASFPGISFDADDEDSDLSDSESVTPSATPDHLLPTTTTTTTTTTTSDPASPASTEGDCADTDTPAEDISTILQTWRTLESLHASGLVSTLGISEFGCARLAKLLPHATVRPRVNQVNVKDCCVVPKPLILFAKKEGIELLTHNDCTDVLPRGTLREILGSEGVLVTGHGKEGGVNGEKKEEEEGLKGDVEPQFVVKYTAVVKDRAVVENKGYFAVAQLRSEESA